ncbi:MAG TPA: hydrogenase maturation protease, partial [Acidimicrobiales bacterium]|nr:hydrogenase maturation protease [Acidimicrobiales bacterium]
MRLHSGIGGSDAGVQCRVLVAGLGMPGLRDLDFGRKLVGYLEALDWPEEVVVEDLSCSAHLTLHRLQELRPAKVVLMASAARGADRPGTLRRYRLDLTPPAPDEVHQGLVETLSGMPDLDHTLAVVRHWGGFPADTVVIEVEPSDCSFGPGFSEELGECIEPILAMIREELGCDQDIADLGVELSVGELTSSPLPTPIVPDCDPEQASDGLLAMAEYAREHERQRLVQPYRDGSSAKRLPLPSGVDYSVRSRPWGVGLG